MGNYKINEQTKYSDETQKQRDAIASIRVSKVMDYLTGDNPALLPFRIEFPIVSDLDYKSFADLILRNNLFDDLPKFVKNKIKDAEKVKYFDTRFRIFLQFKQITPEQFVQKNPKTKLDLMYEWLFENKLDIGILE